MLLARRGYRVLLVDKARFPSDTISTHQIQLSGIARLAKWGVLERLTETNIEPTSRMTMDFGPFALSGFPEPIDGVAVSYSPRRSVLDSILVEAGSGCDAGVELLQGFAVKETDRRRHGVVAASAAAMSTAEAVQARARIVIGADGKHSFVARAVAAPEYNAHPALSLTYYAYFSGVPMDGGIEVYIRDRRAIIAAPTSDGQTMIAIQAPVAEFDTFRRDIEVQFTNSLAQAPEFLARVQRGQRETRFEGTADVPNYFRKPYGPGWALVGDAGYMRDPAFGQGISDAWRDADELAFELDSAWRGAQSVENGLAVYQQRRDTAVAAMYGLVLQLAALEPPSPERAQLFAALAGNQRQTDRWFGVIMGSVSVEEFFSPENVAAIFAEAKASLPVAA